MNRIKTTIMLVSLFVLQSVSSFGQNVSNSDDDYQGIKPYSQNQWYWQYQGEAILLRGGSNDDNPFQWNSKELIEELDLLQSVGGNYIRNTMSDRDEGNLYAFKLVDDGKYDLEQWNEEFWNRLTFFLEETAKRGIIVQLTLWDHFDLGSRQWEKHPWNPHNNLNMDSDTWKGRSDFYATVDKNSGG